jgi:hypothetical protein
MFIQIVVFLGLIVFLLAMDIMQEINSIRQTLIILILGTILWLLYQLLKEPPKPIKIIAFTTLASVVSIVNVIITLVKTGW